VAGSTKAQSLVIWLNGWEGLQQNITYTLNHLVLIDSSASHHQHVTHQWIFLICLHSFIPTLSTLGQPTTISCLDHCRDLTGFLAILFVPLVLPHLTASMT
jgi:hypothetical protein